MKTLVGGALLFSAFLPLLIAASPGTGSGHPTSARSAARSLYFDGTSFLVGAGSGPGTITVRDGYFPATAGEAPHRRLARGTGALAVFCYRQTAGGKLRAASGFVPLAGATVSIAGKNHEEVGEADAGGFLLRAVRPGLYTVAVDGAQRTVQVVKGRTALVALRAGKRMGD